MSTTRSARCEATFARRPAASQIPWITGSIETKFVFRQGDTGKQVAEAEQAAEASGGLTIDEVLWSFISDSQNPEDFERFVKVFPNSRYAAEATEKSRVKVAALTERGLYINGNLVSTSIAAEAPVEASGKALSEEFVFQQAGERAVSETFRVWPSNLPDTQRGMRALVTDCDLYAADPNDPQRQVPGVTNGLVNVRDALRACAFSLAADINNPRLQFQFGRVLDIAGRYNWAEHFYELAGKQQYSAALVNLGYLARVGMGREVDYDRALDFYLAGRRDGQSSGRRTNVGTAYIRGQGVPKTAGGRHPVVSAGGVERLGECDHGAWRFLQQRHRRREGRRRGREALRSGGRYGPDRRHEQSRTRLCRAAAGVEKNVKRGLDLMLKATDMGNQYAPLFAARVFLKGDEGVSADPGRALSLLELSARRGFEDAYLELAKGYRDGAFNSGQAGSDARPTTTLRWHNASRRRSRTNCATRSARRLKADIRKKVDQQVDLFVEQNGK